MFVSLMDEAGETGEKASGRREGMCNLASIDGHAVVMKNATDAAFTALATEC